MKYSPFSLFNGKYTPVLLLLLLLLLLIASIGFYFLPYKQPEFENPKQQLQPRALIISDMSIVREKKSFMLNWPVAEDAASYTLYRSRGSQFEDAQVLATDLTHNSFEDTTLEEDTFYSYFIQACSLEGDCYNFAQSLDRVLVSQPANFTARTKDGIVNLTWNTSSYADAYKIYRSTDEAFSSASLVSGDVATNSFEDTAAETNAPYFYFVQACNQNNCTEASMARNFHIKIAANAPRVIPVKAQDLSKEKKQVKTNPTPIETKNPAQPISLDNLYKKPSILPEITKSTQIASTDTNPEKNPFARTPLSTPATANLINPQKIVAEKIALVEEVPESPAKDTGTPEKDISPPVKTPAVIKPKTRSKTDTGNFYFGFGLTHGTSHREDRYSYKAAHQSIDIEYGGTYQGFHGFVGYQLAPNKSVELGLQHVWKQKQKTSICTSEKVTVGCDLEASINLTSLYALYQYQHNFTPSFGMRAGIGPSLNFMSVSVQNTKDGHSDVDLEYESGTSFGAAMKLALFYNNFEVKLHPL